MLEHLQRLDVEIVSNFLDNRKSNHGIPEHLAEYILEINEASNLYRSFRSVSDCARQLQLNHPHLAISTCRQRVYDAISFFNSDCSVTSTSWDNYFADQMMKLADVNLKAHKFGEARRCFEKARDYRISASANVVDKDLIKFKPQIVSADFKLDRMGDLATNKGILEAWKDAQEIINTNVDASQSEKDRLLDEAARELGIETVDGEEVDE